MFYNAASGAISIGHVGSDGVFRTFGTARPVPAGRASPMPAVTVCSFYRSGNGLRTHGQCRLAKRQLRAVALNDLQPGLQRRRVRRRIRPSGSGDCEPAPPYVLFYRATTGAASTGEIASTGVYTNLRNYVFSTGWTHIASAVSNGPSPISNTQQACSALCSARRLQSAGRTPVVVIKTAINKRMIFVTPYCSANRSA